MELGFDFESMSPVMRKLILVLPALGIAAIAVVFFIMPALNERAKYAAELEQQEATINKVRLVTAKLPALVSENERLRQKLTELRLQLPDSREVSGLLRQVSEIGNQAGLQVVAWKPKERSVHHSKEVYEIPVEVEMRGTYHRFGQFFSMLTGLERIVNITNIQLKQADQKFQKDGTVLSMSFNAVTYSPVSDADVKAMESKAAQEGQKDQKK